MYPRLPCSLKSGQRKRHILHHKSRNYGGAGAEKDWYADVAKQCVAEKAGKNSGSLHNTAETEDYYMFAVADQPYLKSQSVIKLIDKVLENKGNMRLAFSLRCGDTVGNPCVFHSSLIPQLLSLEGDKGGRSVAKKYDCVYVDIADERELMDIDTLSNSKHTVTL